MRHTTETNDVKHRYGRFCRDLLLDQCKALGEPLTAVAFDRTPTNRHHTSIDSTQPADCSQ